MAAYNSLELTPPAYPVSGVGLGGRTYHSARGEFTVTTALATGDTIAMFDLPTRSRVWGGFIKAEGQLDSNGSPTLTLSLGDAALATRYFSASTAVGRAVGATADAAMQATGRDFFNAAKTRVLMTVGTGAATGTTGVKVIAHIQYSVEEPA